MLVPPLLGDTLLLLSLYDESSLMAVLNLPDDGYIYGFFCTKLGLLDAVGCLLTKLAMDLLLLAT